MSGGKLVVNNGLTGISLNGGAILDLQGVIATKGSVNAANQLLLTNGSTLVETLGLVGDNSNFSFNFKTDGAGGTLVTATSIVKIAAGTYAASTYHSVNQLSGLAVDKAGNLHVSEYDNNTVQKFTAGTLTPITIGTGLNKPMDLSLDSSGNVFVVNNSNTNLVEINHVFYRSTDYLYHNASNGGVYYDANGSTSGSAVEIAVIGLTTHPVGLTSGDFTLIA